MSLRLATKADLDAMVWIVEATTRLTASSGYRLPFIDQYPDDLTRQVRATLVENIARTDRVFVVYEIATSEAMSSGKAVVAVASWQLPGTHLTTAEPDIKMKTPSKLS